MKENGVLLRLLTGRMPGPLFVDELQRLEAYALTHGTVAAAA